MTAWLAAIGGVATICTPAHAHQAEESAAQSFELSLDTGQIAAIDERAITYYIDRPDMAGTFPILLVVDGSGCLGQRRPGLDRLYLPGANAARPYARLRVEKPGVEAEANDLAAPCSDEFLKHYTMDNRVFDHLRVLQHLAAHAPWWNGELLIWGWSDGGDVASQLVVYYPNVTRAVLGAAGGGYTMAEHFEDFWACPVELGEGRDPCLASIRADFTRMEDNPTWTETWSGHDNSWRVWASRLRTRLSAPLADNQAPILLVHGALDRDATPVESTRKLVSDLDAAGNTAFTYWEVPAMHHGWSDLPPDRQSALMRGMQDWLLTGEVEPDDLELIMEPGAGAPQSAS